ncbi:hypothetical protein Anas_11411 [Armadillidium nasatum]|uniref:Uncharacterized protein n=1 Tax=Armadillidium nasatum TaxID=96803 RepID=A0A5N5SJS2_9CRUS|nr:hypothetical protein Anas_11411 [Armadillidium nasatum]
MLMAKIMRILRSRITLSVISAFGLIYIGSILIWNSDNEHLIENESGNFRRPQEFRWGSDENINDSRSAVTT